MVAFDAAADGGGRRTVPAPCWPWRKGIGTLALAAGVVPSCAGADLDIGDAAPPPLAVDLLAPAWALDSHGQTGTTFLRRPWPIRAAEPEGGREELDGRTLANSGIQSQDGVEVLVTASAETLPPGAGAALFLNLFTVSFTGTEASVEEWMQDGNLPPPHNPLRLTTLFSQQTPDHAVVPDELGDACLGEAFRAEFCARVVSCLHVVGAEGVGGGRWHVALPAPVASNYRVEAYLGPPAPECQQAVAAAGRPWWAPTVAAHSVASRSSFARYAAFGQFRLLFVGLSNWWWGHHAQVEPTTCWTEMMAAAIDAAAHAPPAAPEQYRLPASDRAKHGLWLEFGVGSGKSTAYIALRLRALLGDAATLHGFDSFRGLPISWAHTKLGAGTFSTGGQVPEHLAELKNVQIHVGLFADTLADLDGELEHAPVPFAHIDVDLYESAVEVLSKIACRLYPGSVLVFDELVNYAGFELAGEYRAWEYVSAAHQIQWEYAGVFWQQAVPVVITGRGAKC